MKSKKIFFIATVCMALFAQVNLLAQSEEGAEGNEGDKTTELQPSQQPSSTGYIKLVHSGGYIANYEVRYQDKGVEKVIESGEKSVGWQDVFYVPVDATNIRLKAWAMTGLVWNPKGVIYDLALQPNDLNKCYKNMGTTISQSWDNNCE